MNLSNVSHSKSIGIIADISKAKEKLRWQPEIDLNQGLKEILVTEGIL